MTLSHRNPAPTATGCGARPGVQKNRTSPAILLLLSALLLSACPGDNALQKVLTPDPSHNRQLWLFNSTDRAIWTRAEDPLGKGFTSLGLSHGPAGELLVTGLNQLRRPTWFEELFPRPWVDALVFDGQRWSALTRSLDQVSVPGVIDPQWLGDRLWYYGVDGKSGDPAHRGGVHRIFSTPPERQRAAMPGLADPSPVRFLGRLYLFATLFPNQVIVMAGEPLKELRRFSGVEVPFAFVDRGTLYLLAQRSSGGDREPLLTSSPDGTTWSPFLQVLPEGEVGPTPGTQARGRPALASCTSPVMGKQNERWFLLCVEEK